MKTVPAWGRATTPLTLPGSFRRLALPTTDGGIPAPSSISGLLKFHAPTSLPDLASRPHFPTASTRGCVFLNASLANVGFFENIEDFPFRYIVRENGSHAPHQRENRFATRFPHTAMNGLLLICNKPRQHLILFVFRLLTRCFLIPDTLDRIYSFNLVTQPFWPSA